MTDHAAEAQKIIRDLYGRTYTGHVSELDFTDTALLAIAHTLQAIHTALTDRPRSHTPNERCGEIRPEGNAAYPCVLAAAHLPITTFAVHIDSDGDMW